MRPSKIQNYMDQAEVVARRSHDIETQVGALLIKNSTGAVIAEGYNGFVRGADDTKLPNTRPNKYPYMVHAEMNLIANCSRHGISMEDTTLICTHSPCSSCMRMLWQCGVKKVIVKQKYKDFQDLLKMEDLSIEVEDTDEQFFALKYVVAT